MRVMVIVKASQISEVEPMPDPKAIEEMRKFNEELVKAGVMLAVEGLQPSSKSKRIEYLDGKLQFIDGPFGESRELVSGYWLWQVKSMDEAVEWARRIPFSTGFQDHSRVNLEIRPLYDPNVFSPELRVEGESQR